MPPITGKVAAAALLWVPTIGAVGLGEGGVLVLIASRVAPELERARVLRDNDSPMERDLRRLLECVVIELSGSAVSWSNWSNRASRARK